MKEKALPNVKEQLLKNKIEKLMNTKGTYEYNLFEIYSMYYEEEDNKLKEDIENGKFSKILITNLTNVSRDTNFNLEFISFAEDNECKIVSMDKFDPHQYKSFIDNVLKKIKEEKER